MPKELETAKIKAVEMIARKGSITPADVIQLKTQKTVVVQNSLT